MVKDFKTLKAIMRIKCEDAYTLHTFYYVKSYIILR